MDVRPRRCARRRMNMFYLIDTSGSMNYNGCLRSINSAMPEIGSILADISMSNHDFGEIFISCIAFGSEARLLHDYPVAATDFEWTDVKADGLTNLAGAFKLLEEQLHRDTGMNCAAGHLRPAIILVTDGDPDPGWEYALAELRKNRWFREAYKIGVAIGATAANVAMKRALMQFAMPDDPGGKPMIISVANLAKLHDILRLVSSTVSRIGSQTPETTGSVDIMRRGLATELDNIRGVLFPAITDGDDEFWD